MGKREMLVRALEKFEQDWCIPRRDMFKEFSGINYDVLAHQAIVIECEAGRYSDASFKHKHTKISQDEVHHLEVDGFEFPPGKALAIIVPLNE